MRMKKIFSCLIGLAVCGCVYAQGDNDIQATMNKVKLDFKLDADGRPVYDVFYGQQPVIKPSRLGIKLLDDSNFDDHFEIKATERKTVDDTWDPVWGEVKHIRNHYEQVTIHLKQQNAPKRLLDIVFRVFEDGVGFRY
jgi:hypothetical protein